MADNNSPMLHALRNKKAQGLDIHILVGPQEGDMQGMGDPEDKEVKELGLAPDGAEPTAEDGPQSGEPQMGMMDEAHPDAPQDKHLIEEELAKAGLARGGLADRASQLRKKV